MARAFHFLRTNTHTVLSIKHGLGAHATIDVPGVSIDGTSGDDDLIGTIGDDVMAGWDGHDALSGGDGNDVLDGGFGDDWVIGQNGNDSLYGSRGNDNLYGGEGNDLLSSGTGNDTLFGGPGDDTFAFLTDSGKDIIKDFGFGDTIRLPGISYSYSDYRGQHNKPETAWDWFTRIGTVIKTDDGREIIIEGVRPEQLHGEYVSGTWIWHL